MNKPTVKPSKKLACLLQRHLRLGEKGRQLFDQSGQALERALSLGVTIGEPIALRDGRQVVVVDQFASSNHAFSAKLFQRFKVSAYKEPRRPVLGNPTIAASPASVDA